MKKGFIAFLILCMTFSVFEVPAYAETTEIEGISVEDTTSLSEEFLRAEQESLSQYDSGFLENHDSSVIDYQKMLDSFLKTRSGDIIYPEYYGGAYIDDEGDLIVYTKYPAIAEFSLTNATSGSIDFEIKIAEYSYNELNDMMDLLNDFKEKNSNSKTARNFNSYWLSDNTNEIIVELEDMSPNRIMQFKKQVVDSPIIVFVQSQGESALDTNINPGDGITTGVISSMGYRARRNGLNGFVTAAHGVGKLGSTVELVGNRKALGVVDRRQWSGSIDAAFIRINSGFTPTNTLRASNNSSVTGSLATSTSLPGAGTVINKLGTVTKHTSGKIISTNASFTYNGIKLTNLTSASYASKSGDSGGIVYSLISSTNTRHTLGIHHGYSGSTRFYVKASLINSAFGLTRY